jgi:ABC-type glycerol-3-phosphate transport system permease component
MPLSVPVLAVVGLFTFMGAWNDFFGPLLYNNRQENYVLALAIQKMQAAMLHVGIGYGLQYPYLMAVSTLATLPVVILFLFAQRTFIEGISVTGLKV